MRGGMALLILTVAAHAEVFDRIAVTVGTKVIAQSEVIRDLRISAFLDRMPVDLSGAQKRKSADRLVDQMLILQEAEFSRLAMPSAEDSAVLLQQVKAQYRNNEEYRAALKQYQITQQDLLNHLVAGLQALRFTELRFRPEVQVTEEEIREYYERMATTNSAKLPPLDSSRDEIQKLLIEQRVSQALDRWLGMQRNDTEILYREAAFE
jgi:hypothetical protein